jgi:hypothetical protein
MWLGADQLLVNPSGAVMNQSRNVGHATRLASRLAIFFTTTAVLSVAAGAAPPSTRTAEAMHVNMSPAERAALIAEATANATTPGATRMATPAERAEMAIPPGRRNIEAASSEQKNASKRREMRSGNMVGLVVGTELMMQRRVALTADGKHLETCGNAAHTHDDKTAQVIARAAKAGAARE